MLLGQKLYLLLISSDGELAKIELVILFFPALNWILCFNNKNIQ